MKFSRKWLVGVFMLPIMFIVLTAFRGDKRNSLISKNLDIFHTVFREIDMMYVDTVDVDGVVEAAIRGMLSKLDPYTVFYPENKDEDLRMMMTGKYAGVGAVIRYHAKHDRVVVVEPYEGMPAYNSGLRAGDILLSIDGQDLKGLPVDEVSDRLRGESGTTLLVKAKREGVPDSIMEVKLTRSNIAFPAVPYYTMFEDSVGYIILNSFTEKCARDVRLSLVDLKNKGARKLVLDLRGNGGGSLAEAVDIVSLFVPKGTVVVSTKGKLPQASQVFMTQREPLDLTIPIVVLVDGQSASASEIVAGALQDLDRGVIMGWRTFGKGLVQTVRDLPYNSSLKITTSKYYTPSGRCVQKIDYSNNARSKDEAQQVVKEGSSQEQFFTLSGRLVKAAGGITPDVELKEELVPNLLYYLANSDVLFDFATDYTRSHPEIVPVEDFVVDDSLYDAFKKAVKTSDFKYDRQSEKALETLKQVATFEGYMEDASEAFALLEQNLNHDLDRDFEFFDSQIRELLADELVSRYYYQRGVILQSIKSDSAIVRARNLLADSAAYRAMLVPVQ